MIWYIELKYSSLHEQLFDFLDKNFIFYPSWGNPDGFFGDFHRPDYLNTPVCTITYNVFSLTPRCHLVLTTFGASLPVHPQQSPQIKTPTESRPIHKTRQTRGSELIQALSNRAMVHHRRHHQVHATRMMHSWCHLFQLSQHPLSRAIHCWNHWTGRTLFVIFSALTVYLAIYSPHHQVVAFGHHLQSLLQVM